MSKMCFLCFAFFRLLGLGKKQKHWGKRMFPDAHFCFPLNSSLDTRGLVAPHAEFELMFPNFSETILRHAPVHGPQQRLLDAVHGGDAHPIDLMRYAKFGSEFLPVHSSHRSAVRKLGRFGILCPQARPYRRPFRFSASSF